MFVNTSDLYSLLKYILMNRCFPEGVGEELKGPLNSLQGLCLLTWMTT